MKIIVLDNINVSISIFILCFSDATSDSITNRNSGKKDIMRRRRANLSSLRTMIELPAPVGMMHEITIIVSKIFQPLLKKSAFFDSAVNLIVISAIKNTVTA